MDTPVLLWGIFAVSVVGVSVADLLFVANRTAPINVATALRWTSVWVAVALLFSAAIWLLHPAGRTVAPLFVAGYLTEYSLSIDNLFVFVMIFSLMGVADQVQPKLIKLGIYLAIVLRVIFILFGVALVAKFHWLLYVFGVLLVATAWKMIRADDEANIDPSGNVLYRLASRLFPTHDPGPQNRAFFVRTGGRLCMTPLFPVFLVIGSTDLLFAIDSIPAILGISSDPFVVLTSNVFAVLGLNSLYFAIRGVMGMFRYLRHGVSLVLFFIGGKMLAAAHPAVDGWFKEHTLVSLGVILTILAGAILLSVIAARREGETRE